MSFANEFAMEWPKEMGFENGRKVRKVIFPNGDQLENAEHELICYVPSEFSNNDEGVWILGIRDGREIERHNVKYIESIVWE